MAFTLLFRRCVGRELLHARKLQRNNTNGEEGHSLHTCPVGHRVLSRRLSFVDHVHRAPHLYQKEEEEDGAKQRLAPGAGALAVKR
jgi:hypothetical protein